MMIVARWKQFGAGWLAPRLRRKRGNAECILVFHYDIPRTQHHISNLHLSALCSLFYCFDHHSLIPESTTGSTVSSPGLTKYASCRDRDTGREREFFPSQYNRVWLDRRPTGGNLALQLVVGTCWCCERKRERTRIRRYLYEYIIHDMRF